MRRFAFLQCIRCRHFEPKKLLPLPGQAGPTFALETHIGICTAAERSEWIVWKSLEWAVEHTGSCPDREPLPAAQPECPLYDLTVASVSKPYPKACVYYDMPACPKRQS